MPLRRGRGRRGAAEPKDRVDRIDRILEGLVQVVHEVHNNNNHDDAPQQPAMPMLGAGAMPRTTIKQFQQLKPQTFYGTPDPMAAESWLLGIEHVRESIGVSVVWELEHVMGVAKKGTRLEIVQRGIEFRELGHQHLPQSSSLQLRGGIINHDKVELLHLYQEIPQLAHQ
ncbi:hypothetical protein Acr_00g0046840 [Actinidia rufa]|uniref:Uncharacterized protein n=1 Tax=Actinidia rufa TaxID=165716 RepID=A0A7J0DJJ0_9ERIC|nr:hypothetical protein Acr_00g0046840 [Actinidia rufa]